MKRPQGFDRPPAPVERPAVLPASPKREPAPREPSPRDAASTARPTDNVTEPIPIVRASGPVDEVSRTPIADGSKAMQSEADPAKTRVNPKGRLPSNREINRAVREARKERWRVERGEVRRFTKRSRRRRMIWLASLGTLVALVAGVALTAFSPLMALRTIDVAGTARIDAAAIKKALENQIGRPLPLVDQGAIRADLAAFPLIRSYSVESHPPNTIVVRIVERQPIGVIAAGAKFDLVDAAKVKIATSDARPDGFPLIQATGAAQDADATSGFAAAASVLSALPSTLLAQVDTITAATRDDVGFTLRGSSSTVVWGSADDSDLKAAALAALLRSVPKANRYDVSSPHSVTTG